MVTDFTVLVVDDNMDMRDYIGRLLMRHYRVETAANGKEALEKIPPGTANAHH